MHHLREYSVSNSSFTSYISIVPLSRASERERERERERETARPVSFLDNRVADWRKGQFLTPFALAANVLDPRYRSLWLTAEEKKLGFDFLFDKLGPMLTPQVVRTDCGILFCCFSMKSTCLQALNFSLCQVPLVLNDLTAFCEGSNEFADVEKWSKRVWGCVGNVPGHFSVPFGFPGG